MSDAATKLLADLSASTNAATAAQTLLTTFRATSGGSISEASFQTVFAEMELEQPSQTQPTSSKVTAQEVIQGIQSGGYVGGQQLTTTPAATG